ncbi:hypothetical protein GS636_06665 [Ruegeria sp. HKCCD4884]|uniref:hypothetical protein n=1 Tax=Ruegeria sp. HKCCD4884 TaxID=2683022 RepID=UPI001492FDDB|nr:hypothetical protein [Ruegeria sp. HKCCD4884]NOD92463.1 hypothetical protein [Ruegeria sp. HKCCD4884]
MEPVKTLPVQWPLSKIAYAVTQTVFPVKVPTLKTPRWPFLKSKVSSVICGDPAEALAVAVAKLPKDKPVLRQKAIDNIALAYGDAAAERVREYLPVAQVAVDEAEGPGRGMNSPNPKPPAETAA